MAKGTADATVAVATAAKAAAPKKKKEERLIIFTLLLLLLVDCTAAAANDGFDYNCFPGIQNSPGVTIPRGDIIKEVHDAPFPIYCHMNPDHKYYKDGYRSDRLGLWLASLDGNQRMESTVVNETTISAVYDPNREGSDMVSCKIQLEDKVSGICYQNIFVGEKPIPPEDFKCISENWSNLNCTWIEPLNPVRTTYALSFMLPGRHGSLCLSTECISGNPEHLSLSGGGNCSGEEERLNWVRTHREGRVSSSVANFEAKSFNDTNLLHLMLCRKNDLGIANVAIYNLSVFEAIVRPGPANNVSLTPVSPHDLSLHFKIPHELEHFPVGLRSRIRYRSEYDPEGQWTELDTSGFDKHSAEYAAEIADALPYAEYTVQIRLLSAKANASETRLWSEPVEKSARSLPKIPDAPPKMALGSFEVVGGLQDRTVFVYWQQIPDTKRNGPNFQYTVSEVFEEGKIKPVNPVNITKAYAVFPNLSLHNHSFYVASQNDMGTATKTSHLFLPHHDRMRGLQPRSFTKIAYSERIFEVSWLDPLNEQDVSSYTVFWCKAEDNRDRPYQCQGYLDWMEVPKGTRTANVTLPTSDIYQFAVAANTPQISSGMIWATCTILHDKVVGKLKTVAVDVVEQDALKVRWRLDCSDRVGIVTGYKIYYCPILSDEDTADCVDGNVLSVLAKPDVEHTWIKGLNPWAFYKVGVAVMTRAGESEISDYLVNKTSRGRPGSPPVDLEVVLLGADEAELFWGPPLIPNAPIDSYQVRYSYRNFMGREETETFIVSHATSAKVRDLLPYANYTMEVKACTTMANMELLCGKDWASRHITTGVGKSGRMPVPKVTFLNSTQVRVEWGHLFHKGGPIRRFDLNVTHQRLRESKLISMVPEDKYEAVLSLEDIGQDWSPNCVNESSITDLYNFTMRAVTTDPVNGETFEGEWSPEAAIPAYCKGAAAWWIICVALPLGIAVALVTCFGLRWYWRIYQNKQLFLKVEEHVVHHPLGGKNDLLSIGAAEKDPPVVWNKDPKYQRADSKESSETLLPRDTKRNISGSSDASSSSSSGCGSARSSEIDYDEKEHNGNVVAPAALATTATVVSEPGYVTAFQYSPEHRRSSLDRELPPGYSKVGSGEEPARVSPGYVPFEQIRKDTFTSSPSSNPPPGYITLAQAAVTKPQLHQMEEATEERLPSLDSSGAYSKVGMNPADSRGYVQPSFLQQQQKRTATVRPQSLWFDPLPSAANDGSQVSNLSDSFSQFRAAGVPESGGKCKTPVFVNESLSLQDVCGGGGSPGYVKANLPGGGEFGGVVAATQRLQEEEKRQQSLLMSPKTLNLKVEARAPYCKAVTSLQNGNSSMV